MYSSLQIWQQIIGQAELQDFEIHTVPQSRKTPVWFRVSTDGRTVFINQARENTPSSSLKLPRVITFDEFDRIFPYYELRLNGTSISQEATSKSVNTVYIYGLIANAICNFKFKNE